MLRGFETMLATDGLVVALDVEAWERNTKVGKSGRRAQVVMSVVVGRV